MVKRLKIYQKDLNGSENQGLDWRSDGRKSTAFEDQTVVQGRKFRGGTNTEKRLTFVRQSVHSFRVSVAEKFSPNGFNRDLIFSFFCTCAELVEVSRQKDKEIKVRFLSDKTDS